MKPKSTINEPDEPRRDRHGHNRGLPPPAEFDITALPDSALLNEREAGAILRLSTNTLTAWRQRRDPRLPWLAIVGGRVRYKVGDLKKFLSGGAPRKRKPKRLGATTTETQTKTAAAAPKRHARRAKADAAAAAEPAP